MRATPYIRVTIAIKGSSCRPLGMANVGVNVHGVKFGIRALVVTSK